MKTCNTCHATKSLDDFHRDPSAKDGRAYRCKQCARARTRRWNAENRERKAAARDAYYADPAKREEKRLQDKAWRQANLERRRASDREYAEKNSAKAVQRVREWRVKQGDKMPALRLAEARRRALRMSHACPSWADHEKIRAIYVRANELGRETGVPHHVDHILPLAGKTMCGLHVHQNLRAIPAIENRRKSRKEVAEIIDQVIADQLQFIRSGDRKCLPKRSRTSPSRLANIRTAAAARPGGVISTSAPL